MILEKASLAGEAQIQHSFKLTFVEFFLLQETTMIIIILGISVKKEPLDNFKTKTTRQEVPLGFVHLTRSYRFPEISFNFILKGINDGIHSSRQMLCNSPLHKFEWAIPEEPVSEKLGDDKQQSIPEISHAPPLEDESSFLFLLYIF